MIVDLDNSFIRLRDNLTDALDLGESPQATICYNTQIRLAKGETYFQISNSPTSIIFNDEYEVHLVDSCDNVVEDITSNVFITEFFDSNGIKQIAWEYVCNSEHYLKPLSFRFSNTVNDDVWYSNLVNITEYDKELTTRFDYKHFENHYGTQYERANYYQSIRLYTYFRNPINEDTLGEYKEVTTGYIASEKPIIARKRRNLIPDATNWVLDRMTYLSYSSSLYVDNVKHSCTTPIELSEPEMDSNIYENELILNPVWNDTFTFSYQIFAGLEITDVLPTGVNTQSSIDSLGKCTFTIEPTLGTGTVTLYDASDDSVISSFTQADLVIDGFSFVLNSLNADDLPNGTYYIQFSNGLISALGINYEGINDKTTWRFELIDGQYSNTQYETTEYLTD